ncbi:unnamed protein product [Lactuca saligna]|uniref:Uncharacterized protein n=1 Tax=Lactuca saligna TaxID=75948 RepID=A0AA35ZKB9_LACSI|nr:unnamed protein product [Lactuca saligna]
MASEKAVFQSCVSNINLYLHNLIETRDSLFTVSVRQHLAKKLQPIFAILNQLQGVLDSIHVPKQGGEVVKEKEKPKPQRLKPQIKKPTEEQHENKQKKDFKVNEASRSKGKGKLTYDDEIEEELFEGEN